MTKKQKSQQKQKFEQTNNQTNQQHKKTISNDVDNNTIKKKFLRICRINNFVNYLIRNSNFHLSRFAFSIFIFVDILFAYEQLSHAQFRRTFVQFLLIKVIENVNRNDKNEQLWKYQSTSSNENFTKEDSIFIFSSSDFCELFNLRMKICSSSVIFNHSTNTIA